MLAAWYQPVLFVMFFVTCVLLILIVLLQKGRGGGLGAAFGGAGDSVFGTRTGDVLTWVTIVLTVLFLLLAIGTTLAYRPPAVRVPPPTFDPPPPGTVDADNYVTIRTETRGATIWYQVDGSEKEAFQPGNPVLVPVGSALTAWAEHENWTPSEKVTVVYGVSDSTSDDASRRGATSSDGPGPGRSDATGDTEDSSDGEGSSDDPGQAPEQ